MHAASTLKYSHPTKIVINSQVKVEPVRQAVEYRHMQAQFDARADAAWARLQQTGAAMPAEEVVAEMRARLEARRRELQGKCRPAGA